MTGQRIKLAEEPPFDLGSLHVEPARREISVAGSEPIKLEPRVMQVLVALAQHGEDVMSRDELVETCWAGVSVSDDAVNRVVSILRRDLAEACDHGVTVDTVTKVGYRLRVAGAASPVPPAEAQAAAIEQARANGLRHLARPLPLLLGLGLVGAVLLALISSGAIGSRATAAPNFHLVSVDDFASGGVASDGEAKLLRDALIKELAQAGIVSVPRQSESEAPLRVVGTFSQIDGHRAVTVRVEDRESGEALWSDNFDLSQDLQRQLAHFIPWAVGNAISCGISGNSPIAPITDTKLVGYFIRSCNEFRLGSEYETLLVHSRRALAYAPDDVVAQLRYAIAAGWTARTDVDAAERSRLIASARRIANRVLDRHPRLGLGYYARGIAEWSDGNPDKARQDLEQAKALMPDYPFTDNALANVAAGLGYTGEAFDLRRQAAVSDHFSLIQQLNLAGLLAQRDELPEAYKTLDKVAAIAPDFACEGKFEIDVWWGDPAAAMHSLDHECYKGALPEKQEKCVRAFLRYRMGQGAPAAAIPACRDFPPRLAIHFEVALGAVDDAVDIGLSQPIRNNNFAPFFAPDLAPLRRDPRFIRIAERFGVLDVWRRTDRWPDFCSDPSLGYDCREVARQVVAQRSR